MLSNRDHLHGRPTSIVGLPSEHIPNLLCEVNAPRTSVDVSIEYNDGPALNPREEARMIALQAEATQRAKDAKLKAFREVLTRRVKAVSHQKKLAAAAAAASSPPRSSLASRASASSKARVPMSPTKPVRRPPSMQEGSQATDPVQPGAAHDGTGPLAACARPEFVNQLSRMEDSYCDSTNIGTDMAVAAHDADASLATDPRGDEEDDHEGGREDEKDGDLLAEDDAENQRFAMLEDSLVGRIVSQSFILDDFARAKLLKHKRRSTNKP